MGTPDGRVDVAEPPPAQAGTGAGNGTADTGPPLPERRLTTQAWREESLTRATELLGLSTWLEHLPQDERPRLDPAADRALHQAIEDHVAEARAAAEQHKPRWRTGGRLARAASNLDAAEADLLRRVPLNYLLGQLPGLYAHVRRHLPRDDPRRMRVKELFDEKRSKETRRLDAADRENLIGAVRAASSAAEREQQRVRSFCSILYGATAGLAVLAVLVAALGWISPRTVALCFAPQDTATVVCPTGQGPVPGINSSGDIDDAVAATVSRWDVPLIEFLGAVAAGVSGAVALRRIRGTSTPFGIPVALAVLKLPTGALTAFLGLLLMRGGFVPGLTALDSTPQIVAWAVIFGASQQLFTGLVDKQAQSVLDSVGNKAYAPSGSS
jgi:hypothetical protein